jgi:hypothetical protein
VKDDDDKEKNGDGFLSQEQQSQTHLPQICFNDGVARKKTSHW